MSALITALRSSTKDQHTALENVTRLPQSLTDVSDITSVLTTFWGYYASLDKLLQQASSANLPADISARPLRSQILVDDLTALGANVPERPKIAPCSSLPLADTTYRQWGIRYVIEGSALGGKTVRSYMLQHHELAPWAEKIRFFNVYGAETALKWKGFLSELLKLQPTPAEQAQAVEAASGVFATLTEWFKAADNVAPNNAEALTGSMIKRAV